MRIQRLHDVSIKHKAAQGMRNLNGSLRAIYILAEQTVLEEVMFFYCSQPVLKPVLPESSECIQSEYALSEPPIQSAKQPGSQSVSIRLSEQPVLPGFISESTLSEHILLELLKHIQLE